MPDEIKKSPDEWASAKGLSTSPVDKLLLAGMKVHAQKNAVGDVMTEAEFDHAWLEYATLPVGR